MDLIAKLEAEQVEALGKKIPDFKVCTQNYTVENTPKWAVGHTDEWQYKTKDEESK